MIVDQPKASHKHHAYAKHIFNYGKAIEKFPNYLSIHAGGIIISERPLSYHTALLQMPKGFPITYFDMYGACFLYTSDAADERSSVDLGGRRFI